MDLNEMQINNKCGHSSAATRTQDTKLLWNFFFDLGIYRDNMP